MADGYNFPISALALADSKIAAIRVQDIIRQAWFNWDDPPRQWDALPECTPGAGALYIAAYAINNGPDGYIRLQMYDESGVLAEKTEWVLSGQGIGIEWTGTMPNRQYVINIIADDMQ